MDVLCTADMCPVILNSTCVFYEGNTLTYTGITTNDSLQTALQKIDAKFGDAMVGYIFTNGVSQPFAGAPVGLGGNLTEDISIGGDFTLAFAGNVEAAKHITTGGTSSDFVKGDGTLDSNAYQVAGNYITALTGDVIANGPGSATASLAVVNSNPGTYGSGTRIPVVTVDTKGRVTALTTTAINVPSGILSFVGDVYGTGTTGSSTTLTLSNVNSNVYNSNTFLKFKVNAKGLVTGAAPITHVDIEGVLGYVPVPETRTITINGITHDLQTNASWTLPAGVASVTASAPLSATTGVNPNISIPKADASTDGYLDNVDWATFNAKQAALNGTGLVRMSGTTVSYDNTAYTPTSRTLTINGVTYDLSANRSWTINSMIYPGAGIAVSTGTAWGTSITDNSTNWNIAYNRSIVSASVTGTTSKTLTLTEQDGSTITASWTDIDTNLVTSVFGRTGAIAAEDGDYTTTLVTEGTNLYFTEQRARAAISSTITAITYTNSTGVLSLTSGYVIPTTTEESDWNTAYSERISSASGPLSILNHIISIAKANATTDGYLSATDWNTFNSKQPAGNYVTDSRTISTTGPLQGGGNLTADRTLSITQSGASTDGYLSSTDWNTFNSKEAAIALGTTSQYWRGDKTWQTLNTTVVTEGTNLYYTDARVRAAISVSQPLTYNSTTGQLGIQVANSTQGGYLTSTDWSTFNNKQNAGNYITALTGEATASGPGSAAVTLSTPAVTGKVLTGVNITGGSVVATDTILEAFGKLQNQINALIGSSIYKGTWNASTNTPTLTSSVGTRGWYYIVSVPGTTNLNGITDWQLGDWAIYDGSAWQKVDNTDAVISVNGYTGAVSLVSSDIPEGLTNLYWTSTRFNTAFSGKTTTDLTEGTNLYYTAARFNTAFSGKTTTDLTEGTNLYYTPARARTAISLTTTGTSGAATYNNVTGVLNIPIYTPDLSGYVPTTRTLSINGTTYDLSADRSWTVSGTMPAGGTAGQILSKIDGTDYNTQWIDNFATQVKNDVKLGAALTKGTPVYVSSANGTNMIVSASSNTTEATSSKTFGLLETGGAVNDIVKVVTYGLLAGLDTSAATAAGDPVWLGTNGTLLYGLANKPYAPAHLVYIGIVTRKQSNNGEIFINVQNGFELDELHNVSARTPSNNDVLYYNTSTSLWQTASIPTVLGYTPEQPLTFSSPLVRTVNTISIPAATASVNGYLSSTDWTTFNNKQDALTNPVTGTGTTGYVTFWNGTNTVTADSALFWNNTSKRLGINTVAPSTFLHVYYNSPAATFTDIVQIGSANGRSLFIGTNNYGFSLNDSANRGGWGIDTDNDSGFMRFYYGASEKVRFQSNGYVGIGLTYAAYKLDVAGDINVTGNFKINGVNINSGTVTSVAALTIGTIGTDLSSSVANSTTTPVITLNVPTASATNRGVLSSADWTTFNSKQAALSGTGFVKISGTTISYDNSTYLTTSAAASTYLMLGGGTMTGALIGTSAGFTGYVGVGNTSPLYPLDVTGNARVSGQLILGSTISTTIATVTYTYTLPSASGTIALVGGAGVGTVTSVSGTGTVSGLTLTGTVTSSGSLTLGGTLSLTSGQVTTALGYTPYNSTNPSGYITGITSGMVTTALGYTPYNSSNPSGYITSSGSITGNAATSTSTTFVSSPDGGRNPNTFPLPNTTARALSYTFAAAGYVTGATGNYAGVMTYAPWDGTSASTGDSSYQLAFCNWSGVNASGLPGLAIRNGINSSWNSTWYQVLHSGNYTSYSPSLTGSGASGTWGISISGNAATATSATSATTASNSTQWGGYNLPTRTNWQSRSAGDIVVGQLSWKNYGNSHTIFDASQSTSPDGGAVNNTNATYAWSATYPTLMGWNGSNTYGVRVDSARYADSAGSLSSMNISQFTNNSGYIAVNNQSYFGINNTSNSSGNGISLYGSYGGGAMNYGLMFAGTATYGTHGSISGDWATYFMMNDDTTRGWIFRRNGAANVASISGGGSAQFNGTIGAGGTITAGLAQGFLNANYQAGYNRIWAFATALPYGIGYWQGGTDYIGFHFGTTASAYFNFYQNGNATFNGNFTNNGFIRVGASTNLYLDTNYGCSVVGVYSSDRYQGVFAMGDAYKLAIDGTSPGNLYGLSWSHPNAGGQAGYLNSHGLLVMVNGITYSAISSNIWARGNITANGGVYSNDYFRSYGNTGWYNDTYGQGLRQVKANATYGNVIVMGENYNGWSGYNTNNSVVTAFMQNSSGTHGFYQENGAGWTAFYNYGYACWGLGTDATDPSYSLHITKYGGSNTGWIIWSDRRIKENIKTIDNALDKILSLRGVYYNKIDDETKTRQVGYIAQEVLEVVPELVVYSEELDIYNMNYAPMVAMLTEAMKEQQSQIDTLKEQVQTLLNHINNGI